jgi:hypothetical protein
MITIKGIFIAMILGGFSLLAQANLLTISPRFTSAYRFAAVDAWNLDLQFTGASNLRVYLTANISNAGKIVAILRSGELFLTSGAQSISSTTITTAQLQYLNQGISDIESLTGSFPAGNYKVCYHAYCITPDCDGLGADAVYNETPDCFDLIVEPPTPLLLASPEDKAELEFTRPTFNWIPPMPISGVSGFNYMYTLVQKNNGQTCQDAIVRNRPLYKEYGIEQPVKPYPAEMDDLDTGKSYCWKVDGLVGDIPVAQSEVWEFKVEKKQHQDSIKVPYYNLSRNNFKTFEITGSLGINYRENRKKDTIKYQIIDADSKTIIISGVLLSKYGENKFEFNFQNYPAIHTKKLYVLEFIDSSGVLYNLRFIVRKK